MSCKVVYLNVGSCDPRWSNNGLMELYCANRVQAPLMCKCHKLSTVCWPTEAVEDELSAPVSTLFRRLERSRSETAQRCRGSWESPLETARPRSAYRALSKPRQDAKAGTGAAFPFLGYNPTLQCVIRRERKSVQPAFSPTPALCFQARMGVCVNKWDRRRGMEPPMTHRANLERDQAPNT